MRSSRCKNQFQCTPICKMFLHLYLDVSKNMQSHHTQLPSNILPQLVTSSFSDVQLKLNNQFQILHASMSTSVSSGRVIPMAQSGSFCSPCKRKHWGKAKRKSEHKVVIKDDCQLPNPRWNNVPRYTVQETLVRPTLYIDAWTSLGLSLSSFRYAFRLSLYLFFRPPTRRFPSCSSP